MTQVGSIRVSLRTTALMIFIIGCPFGHLHLFLIDFSLGGFQFDILVWLPEILNVVFTGHGALEITQLQQQLVQPLIQAHQLVSHGIQGLADESAINMLPTNSAIFKRLIG
jgi:hypothetical protein